jgi:hypothetical protein
MNTHFGNVGRLPGFRPEGRGLGQGRADPGRDTLWTLAAAALACLLAALAAPVNRAAGVVVPIVYW